MESPDAPSPPHAVSTERLTKRFGSAAAVDAVTLEIPRGVIHGLMGHNGAGKTTLIRMLLGLIRPTEGTGTVLGLDIVTDTIEIRRRCGFLPADFKLPGDTTARRFLRYIGSMFDMPPRVSDERIDELAPTFHLEECIDRRMSEISTGMMQKIGLAQALINKPDVLLLDEPTAGLDPIGRHEFLEHLRWLAAEQSVTVLFSTHILSDIESVCESAAVLHRGAVVADDRIDTLKTRHGCDRMDDLYLELVRDLAT